MWRELSRWVIDSVILDARLPGEDGTGLRRTPRSRSNIPIIMPTAQGGETDRVVGLEVGADDYLVKPFSPRELPARVRSVPRRVAPVDAPLKPKLPRFAGWSFDRGRRESRSPRGIVVHLSSGEFDLLGMFLDNADRAVSRGELPTRRGNAAQPFDRSVDISVGRPRRKLDIDGNGEESIKSIRGFGCRFTVPVEEFGCGMRRPTVRLSDGSRLEFSAPRSWRARTTPVRAGLIAVVFLVGVGVLAFRIAGGLAGPIERLAEAVAVAGDPVNPQLRLESPRSRG